MHTKELKLSDKIFPLIIRQYINRSLSNEVYQKFRDELREMKESFLALAKKLAKQGEKSKEDRKAWSASADSTEVAEESEPDTTHSTQTPESDPPSTKVLKRQISKVERSSTSAASYSSVKRSHQSHQLDILAELEKLPVVRKKIAGFSMGIIAGLMFGTNFTPPQWVIDNVPGASTNGLDFVYSHFTGILMTSTLIVVVYCSVQRNVPHVYPEAILPGLLSGFLWAVSQTGWFIANSALSFVITFPILQAAPALIAVLLGYFIFRENRGRRNLILLGVAGALCVISILLTTLAKVL